jgi:cytochrome P450
MDLAHEMMSLTMEVVERRLRHRRLGEADEIGESLTAIIASSSGSTTTRPSPPEAPAEQPALPAPAATGRHDLPDDRRTAKAEDRGDPLSMLLLATDTEGDGTGMTDLQLRDEVMTIFLAGHETTANALTWTFYLLSQNPEAESRLFDEVDRVLGGRPPAVEDLAELRFTEQVFAESMRLFPPAWARGRKAIRDQEIAATVFPGRTMSAS